MKKLLLLLLFFSTLCIASDEEYFLGYGVGVFHDADTFLGQNKYLEFGRRSMFFDDLNGAYWQWRTGFWGDGSSDSSRKSGAWASIGLGLEVTLSPVEIRSGWSIGAISTPDSQLGGRFPQFNGELYLGVRDIKGGGIGLQYEHISSAGILTPNQGRDFITLQLSQKW